ncbi:[protein-PII] uridylyltransferase [Nocardioides glacieisoli]|uniref:Bifunctional uridylyltransferase/uridylyl-removing enzyme n=1 Tax=Nocardioides glacieisoli TaxID=1168730 RepID=A0A4Q2S713_9ACTN|nr:[protein-PII] uridylyltransferase [Nocardioides glacieisoli]RYB96265.1 [protein-PII] uridylyltransferase [Nocardioides glacieisoli]
MTAAQRQTRATSADELCREAYAASAGPVAGVALVAVGGYGRGELAPHSDLDVVLVHEDDVDLGELGSALWYPLWDSGRRLDHSVRSMGEVVDAAADLRVALGLLDVRHLAGDPGLTLRLRTTMLADWRRQARTRLPELKALTRKRHDVTGELAHASVPDVKEAEGGLRDAGVLKAIEASWLVDASTPALEAARLMLLDVRDEVQDLAGRPSDRIAPEMWVPLAERLDLPDAEAAQRHVRSLGRRITHLSRLAWRRTDAVTTSARGEKGRRTPALERIAPGIALSRGEVVLDAGTKPGDDPTLLLRAAAEAASRDAVLAPTTAARLVREGAPLPVPWPAGARDALVRLLASGPGLLPVWETLDEIEGIATFLPEWENIRLLPHASAIHRFTVDRHVVETCAEAGSLIRTVRRPDLLLVAALLHDIGKGSLHDHSVAGEPVARKIVSRMGFTDLDAEVVASLVRWHLLLADLATTRDPDDPATTTELLTHVPDAASLDLLRALTEADARATSPQAWTTWRASLVDRLVLRADTVLGAEASPVPPVEVVPVPDVVRRDPGAVSVSVEPHAVGATVTVVAADRVGLLADVAGGLAALRVPVHAARAWAQVDAEGEWGVSAWEVPDAYLDATKVRDRIRRVVEGSQRLPDLPERPEGELPPIVEVRADASRASLVLEIRTSDRPGVVHRVLTTLAGLGLTVASAHVSTLGPQAVDVFYVQEDGGVRPTEERAAAAAHAVRTALGG